MKSIFYLLTILFLSLLIACSEEPPTNVEIESLSKKPPKDPPPTPDPLVLNAGDVHIISGTRESIRNKDWTSFRVWTNFNGTPQIREQAGEDISVALYDIDSDGIDDLLVYVRYITGNGRHAVEHFELQIWQHDDVDIPSATYELDGF